MNDPGVETQLVQVKRMECLRALAVACLTALAFLGSGIRTDRAVVPFPPEAYEPMRTEALEAGRIELDELRGGEPSGGDKYGQSLAWDQTLQERLREGEFPRWTDRIASGAPFVPQMAQPYQPWNLLLLLIDAPGHYGVWWLLHCALFGFGAFWFLRRGGVSERGAQFAVVLAALGLWTQARVHHNVIVTAALSVWPLLTIARSAVLRGRTRRHEIGLIGVLLGSAWSTGFVPVALFTCYLVGAYALTLAIRERHVRSLLGLGLGCALGGLIALAQMVPVLVAASQSARAAEVDPQWFVDHSLHWRHLLTTFWPDWLHERAPNQLRVNFPAIESLPPPERYFNSTETAFSLGLPAALLAPMAFVKPRSRLFRVETWFFFSLTVLSLGIAMAVSGFFEFTTILPGARTGDLRRFLFLVHVGWIVLAAQGLDRLTRVPHRFLFVSAAALAVCLWSLARFVMDYGPFGGLDEFASDWGSRLAQIEDFRGERSVENATAFFTEQLRAAPDSLRAERDGILTTFLVPAIVALICALTNWFLNGRSLAVALIGLSVAQLWFAGLGSVQALPVERVMTPPAMLAPVFEAEARRSPIETARLTRLESPTALPVPTLYPPNLGALHGLHDLSAYNPLPQGRMEQLFLAIEPPSPSSNAQVAQHQPTFDGSGVRGFFVPETLNHPMLDVLGARFVLSSRIDLPLTETLIDRTPEGSPATLRLYERTTTLPRVTFLDRTEVIPEQEPRLAALGDPNRDPSRVAIVEVGVALEGDGESEFEVAFLSDEPERIELDVTVSERGLLRLADPWDAGWRVSVDGETQDLLVTDHYLRGVRLEPGSHRVVFSYDQSWVVWPPRLSLLALLGAVVLIVVGRRRLSETPTSPTIEASSTR
ncbi:MAG: hypothetical protein AAF196_09150 [Planctomycetota bacterium]